MARGLILPVALLLLALMVVSSQAKLGGRRSGILKKALVKNPKNAVAAALGEGASLDSSNKKAHEEDMGPIRKVFHRIFCKFLRLCPKHPKPKPRPRPRPRRTSPNPNTGPTDTVTPGTEATTDTNTGTTATVTPDREETTNTRTTVTVSTTTVA